jgi:hypothetical protein
MHTVVDGLLRVLVDTAPNPPRHVVEPTFGAEIRAGAGKSNDLLVDRTGYPNERFTFVHRIVSSAGLPLPL